LPRKIQEKHHSAALVTLRSDLPGVFARRGAKGNTCHEPWYKEVTKAPGSSVLQHHAAAKTANDEPLDD